MKEELEELYYEVCKLINKIEEFGEYVEDIISDDLSGEEKEFLDALKDEIDIMERAAERAKNQIRDEYYKTPEHHKTILCSAFAASR